MLLRKGSSVPTAERRDGENNRWARGRSALLAVMGLLLLAAAPASATGAVQVSAGGGHSCAIQIDQTIVCWGSNSNGQAAPPPGTFQAVDAGGLHTCGIRTDGTAECWGNNTDGEATAPPGTFLSVSAGGDHSCGVRTDNTLACWGRNTQSPPFNVAPPGSFTAVSAGNTAGTTWSCALSDAGAIVCWGYNSYGRGNPPPGVFAGIGAGDRRVRAELRQLHHLLGRLQLKRRTAAAAGGRDLHRRQQWLRPFVRPQGRPDTQLRGRRRRWAGDAPGRDLRRPECRLLTQLRGADQRRRCLLGLQRQRPGEPDPALAHAADG